MRVLKIFPTYNAARAFAHEKVDAGCTLQEARMELLDRDGNYMRLGSLDAGDDAMRRFLGIEWDSIDWSDAGPIDGSLVAILAPYVGRNRK